MEGPKYTLFVVNETESLFEAVEGVLTDYEVSEGGNVYGARFVPRYWMRFDNPELSAEDARFFARLFGMNYAHNRLFREEIDRLIVAYEKGQDEAARESRAIDRYEAVQDERFAGRWL